MKVLKDLDALVPRRRVYRCFQCGEKLTKRDCRLGVVAIPIETSLHGCRRVAVHARCEIVVDDDALGLF